jgi:hypothetical protein
MIEGSRYLKATATPLYSNLLKNFSMLELGFNLKSLWIAAALSSCALDSLSVPTWRRHQAHCSRSPCLSLQSNVMAGKAAMTLGKSRSPGFKRPLSISITCEYYSN